MTFKFIQALEYGYPIVEVSRGPTQQFQRLFNRAFKNSQFINDQASAALAAANDFDAEAERIRDVMGVALVAGSNITITVSDGGDTITIAAAGSGSAFAFDGGSAASGGRGFVCDGGTSAALSDLDYWIDGGAA